MLLDNISFVQFLPDFFNILFLFTVVACLSIQYQINKKYFIVMSISLFLPPLFYLLWHWSFLPDQSKYADLIYNFRNLNYNKDFFLITRVDIASWLLSLFPIPFITTIVSVSLINKGMLCATVIYFLNKKKYNFLVLILLFLPSMIVLSSVALRDMLAVILGIFFFYYFIEKKNIFKSFIFCFFFILVKPLLGIISLSIAISYFIFFIKGNLRKINKILFFCFLVISAFTLIYIFEGYIIFYRNGFLSEQLLYRLLINDNINANISISLIGSTFFDFLFSPFSTEEMNLKNIIVFIENIFFFYVAILVLRRIYKENQIIAVFWSVVWVFTFAIFGLIVVNAGTIWRYKIVLEMIIFSATYFSLKKKINLNFF